MTVVVAGAGLAGLVAACRLAEAGRDVTVFESRDEVGGRVRTDHRDGFTLDRGFQVLFTAYPAARRELDRGALDLRRFAPGVTIARPGHRSTLSDPVRNPRAALPTLFNRDVTLGDKVRLWRLSRQLRGGDPAELLERDDRTIAAYLRDEGFSRRFLDNVAAPLFGGITLDRRLGTTAAVFRYTLRMLAEGRAAVPADGMAAIPEQLADRARAAGATIETGRAVDDVLPEDGQAAVTVGGETVTAEACVVATDPTTAARLAGVAIPADTRGVVTQYVAIDDRDLDTGTRLVLNAADARPNTLAPLSAVAPEYAPDGRALLAATFLGEQDADDDALAAEVREALSSWYPEHRFDGFEAVATVRVDHALIAQAPGTRDLLPAVDERPAPLYLAGDYTRWSSFQGAMESGRLAARAVLDSEEAA